MKRREFVILTCAAIAGCAAPGGESKVGVLTDVTIDAGAAAEYRADGVYDRYRDRGFFVVRRGEKLFALSAICTHRNCKLRAETDQSFYCKCHGSTFDREGHVTEGPATRDLPVLPSSVDANGRLVIHAVVM
jgi:cytochrome b6-f complex iron-sulfur subunit